MMMMMMTMCCVNIRIQILKVWLKSVLPLLKYVILGDCFYQCIL